MKSVKVKSYSRKATIWDNMFLELATLNRTLALTAEQMVKNKSTKIGYEYTYFKNKRDKLEKQLLRGF